MLGFAAIKHILLGLIVLYCAVAIIIALTTSEMSTARGKHRRDSDPQRFWLHLGLRAAMGAAAVWLFFAGV